MRVFTVIGVVFILIGVFVGLISPVNFKSHAKPVQAHIEDIKESFETKRYRGRYKTEKSHTVLVSYTYNDKDYETYLDSYSFLMKEGNTIKVYVDINNPNNVRSLSTDMLLGASFFSLGVVVLFLGMRNLNTINEVKLSRDSLVQSGKKVYAMITSCEEDYSIEVNGKHPLCYTCVDDDGNNYKSDSYFSKSTGGKPLAVGTQVLVYVDSSDSSSYFVDIVSRYKDV